MLKREPLTDPDGVTRFNWIEFDDVLNASRCRCGANVYYGFTRMGTKIPVEKAIENEKLIYRSHLDVCPRRH